MLRLCLAYAYRISKKKSYVNISSTGDLSNFHLDLFVPFIQFILEAVDGGHDGGHCHCRSEVPDAAAVTFRMMKIFKYLS